MLGMTTNKIHSFQWKTGLNELAKLDSPHPLKEPPKNLIIFSPSNHKNHNQNQRIAYKEGLGSIWSEKKKTKQEVLNYVEILPTRHFSDIWNPSCGETDSDCFMHALWLFHACLLSRSYQIARLQVLPGSLDLYRKLFQSNPKTNDRIFPF